jgi:hypothetical protein
VETNNTVNKEMKCTQTLDGRTAYKFYVAFSVNLCVLATLEAVTFQWPLEALLLSLISAMKYMERDDSYKQLQRELLNDFK